MTLLPAEKGQAFQDHEVETHSLLSAAGAGHEMKDCGEAGPLRHNLHEDHLMKCKRTEMQARRRCMLFNLAMGC